MAKPDRSPILGYNHNVKYRGRIFHVQTEDSGPGHARIFTHLYSEGTILASKKHQYDPTAAEDIVRALMQGQHKSILKELKGGVHDARIQAFLASQGQAMEPSVAAGPAALDLDAAPDDITPRIVPLQPGPAGGQRATGAVPESRIIDDDETTPTRISLPPPPPAPDQTAEFEVPHVPVGDPVVPVLNALGPSGVRIPTPGPVAVQRTVAIGGPTPEPPRTRPPRRPVRSIPYVVKEGSHPLADPAAPGPVDLPAPVSLAPPHARAPMTSAAQTHDPTPEPIAEEKSLDEVILAYLAQGGEGDGR